MENRTSKDTDLLHHPGLQHVLESVPPILRNFPPEDLRAFLLCGRMEEYTQGDMINSKDEEQKYDGLLIADGIVSLYMEDIYITKLMTGDFIGESFLFKKKLPDCSLIASKPVLLLRFQRNTVLEFFELRTDRLFKIFMINLVDFQHLKLERTQKKIMHLQRKLIEKNKLDM